MPVAIAGMPLEDQLVLTGGQLDQCRAAAEWKPTDRTFLMAAYEHDRVRNNVSLIEGPLNAQIDATNLERLRNFALSIPPKPDELEQPPVYAEGKVDRATISLDHILTRSLALRASYTYSDARSTFLDFAGNRIPFVPRHLGAVGLTLTPGWHTYVTALGVYRSERFIDEANSVALKPGWDAQVSAYAETRDKRWAVELRATNLLKKDTPDVFVVTVSYRF